MAKYFGNFREFLPVELRMLIEINLPWKFRKFEEANQFVFYYSPVSFKKIYIYV